MRELYEADFHKLGSIEAGEYGLTREVVAVAGLLWISRCVLGGADFISVFFFRFFFFERTRLAASMRPPCLIYLPTSTWVRTGCHYIISLSVCQCGCNIRRFLLIARAIQGRFHKLGINGSGRVWANAWDVFPRMPSRAAVDFVVCFGWGGFFFRAFLIRFFFSSNTHRLLQV